MHPHASDSLMDSCSGVVQKPLMEVTQRTISGKNKEEFVNACASKQESPR